MSVFGVAGGTESVKVVDPPMQKDGMSFGVLQVQPLEPLTDGKGLGQNPSDRPFNNGRISIVVLVISPLKDITFPS